MTGLTGLGVLAAVAACGGDPVAADGLEGGVLATFAVGQDRFRVWITDGAAADAVMMLEAGSGTATIPNGGIRRGPGPGEHNAPWSWHLDGSDIEMAELTAEVCDGAPSYVEQNLGDYLQIGRYCPWGATLLGAEDRR